MGFGQLLHKRFINGALALAVVFAWSAVSFADSIYKYKDGSGKTHYVDDPSKIPAKYRPADLQPAKLPELMREKSIPSAVGKSRPLMRTSSTQVDVTPEQPLYKFSKAPSVEESAKTVEKNQQSFSENFKEGFNEGFSMGTGGMFNKVGTKRDPKALNVKGPGSGVLIFILIVFILNLISLWILFERAGLPGVGVIIPIYNLVLLCRLAGRSGWWNLWLFVPFLGAIIWSFTVYFGIAKSNGRGDGFAIATIFLPFLCIPVMAFSHE